MKTNNNIKISVLNLRSTYERATLFMANHFGGEKVIHTGEISHNIGSKISWMHFELSSS
jgi:hypothetical protein